MVDRRQLLRFGGPAAAGAAALSLVVAMATRGGDEQDVSAGSTTSAPAVDTTVDTTIPLLPVGPGEVPSTTAAAAPPTTAAETTASSVAVPAEPLGPAGSLLARPATATARSLPSGAPCDGLVEPGWTGRCGTGAGGDRLTWVVEVRSPATTTTTSGAPGSTVPSTTTTTAAGPPAGAERVRVWRRTSATSWSVVLEAVDAGGTRWAAAGRAEDLTGDGVDELVIGFRTGGPQGTLLVDVVEPPGIVGAHLVLGAGSARTSPGQLDTWARDGGGARHDVIRRTAGAWRVVARETVRHDAVPASHV